MVNNRFRGSFVLCLLLALSAITVPAQESYEGLAAIGRFGRFPSGLFGASNLVPPNTLVTVRNLETGRSERILITDGVSQAGVFLVLSPEAGESLQIDPGGATRVRLTEIRTRGVSVGPVGERALSPDPDINPMAAVSLIDTLPPAQPVDGEPPASRAAEAAPVAEPPPRLAEALAAEPPSAQTPDREPERKPAIVVKPEAAKPASELEASEPEAIQAPRTGIAAGVARSSVGQAQQTFERPEAAITAPRPDRVPVPTPEAPREPVVRLEASVEPEQASAGLESRIARPAEPLLPVAAEPTLPVEPEPLVTEATVDVLRAEPAIEVVTEDGPIDVAIRSVMSRLPRKDVYPAPAGETGEIGFRAVGRPGEAPIVAVLPEAETPAVERPSLAGLAPLRAAPADLDVMLAEADLPAEDRPDFAGLGLPSPVSAVRAADLPEAAPGEDQRPSPTGLVRLVPGDTSTPDGPLAEADAPAEDRPELADLRPVSPRGPEGVDVDLVEARPEAEERPEGSLAGTAPAVPAEISPDVAIASLPAEDDPQEAESPFVRPADVPHDAILALEPADFRPPASPEPDTESIIAREAADRDAVAEIAGLVDPVAPADEVEPATPGEPVVAARPEPEPSIVAEREPLPEIDRLAVDQYYLQIGAYSSAATAQVAVDALAATYPMTVLPLDRSGRTIYRVLVGPLERDETGMLMLWLRARGYRDTFLRSGSEL